MENTVTIEGILNKIKSKTFTRLPSGKTTVCELVLENGFSVRGEASVVDINNFDQTKAEQISYDDAVKKIWQLEGYLLQEKLYQNF